MGLRSRILRIAANLPKGDETRRQLLAALSAWDVREALEYAHDWDYVEQEGRGVMRFDWDRGRQSMWYYERTGKVEGQIPSWVKKDLKKLGIRTASKVAGKPDRFDLEDAAVIQEARRGYDAALAGDRIGNFDGVEEALKALVREMNRSKYWPEIYSINERGNVDLIDQRGKILKSWV
jgi:hypothetical protein